MRRVSTADLIRNFGTYSDTALSEPVIITKNGRERLVLLNVDEYNVCRQALDAYEEAKAGRLLKNRDPGVPKKRRTDP